MTILEAFQYENNIMRHKLVTLRRGTSKLPVVTANISKVTLTIGATTTVSPTTLNFDGTNNQKEPGGYMFTIADSRLLASFQGIGASATVKSTTTAEYTSTAVSATVRGDDATLMAINSTSLFGTNTKLLTTMTIEGVDSGAKVTIPVEISQEIIATVSAQGETGIVLR